MISKQEVKWLARLAKLSVEDETLDSLTKDLDEIVGFAGLINSAVAEESAGYKGQKVCAKDLREDVVRDCSPQSLVLSNVGGGDNGYFPVKRRKVDGK
jgi:aspartyl-tRNA(Asn)/glutamyl-tRNA(Gln) amidotransferase subunit C